MSLAMLNRFLVKLISNKRSARTDIMRITSSGVLDTELDGDGREVLALVYSL